MRNRDRDRIKVALGRVARRVLAPVLPWQPDMRAVFLKGAYHGHVHCLLLDAHD